MKSWSSAVKRGCVCGEPYQYGSKAERVVRQSELDEILEQQRAEMFKAGFDEGSAKGYELGDREGSRRATEEAGARLSEAYADRLATLDGLIREIKTGRERLIRSAEQEAAALALQIAARVLCRTVEASSLSPELVDEAMRQTMECSQLVVRLNPADREALTQAGESLESRFGAAGLVEFVDDESVGRCGCVVESNMGIVDARLDAQLEQLRHTLLDSHRT